MSIFRYFAATALAVAALPAFAADHSDTALLNLMARQNAELTDLHAFVRNGKLILAVSTNPAIPVSAASYQFPADLTIEIHVDNDSEVTFDDPVALATYGGTIVDPEDISEDIVFRVTFDAMGAATLTIDSGPGDDDDDEDDDQLGVAARGLSRASAGYGAAATSNGNSSLEFGPSGDGSLALHPSSVKMFAGLRDDPFIRCPRAGRNVGAVVLSIPLHQVLDDQSTLLLWATADVDDVFGPCEDAAGRSLRSMFSENDMANAHHPRAHAGTLGIVPDVMIYDTSEPAAFPNGRELLDDVVAAVADPRVVNTCPPFPNGNDVPFLPAFPFLAAPHPPLN